MEDPLSRFANEYQAYNRIGLKRRREQIKALNALEQHAGVPLTTVDASQFRSFMGVLVAREHAPSYVEKIRKMILPFMRWARSEGIISADQMLAIAQVPVPGGVTPGVPRPYNRQELDSLWAELAAGFPRRDARGIRRWERGFADYRHVWRHGVRLQLEAMIALALGAGLRKHEAYSVRLVDIHPDNEFIVVRRGKGGKAREVPHCAYTRQALSEWLDFREKLDPTHHNMWIMLRRNGGSWSQDPARVMSWRHFEVYLRSIGDWEMHRLRHTAATEWLRAGVEIEKVSRMLGHAKLAHTQRYTQIIASDVARSMGRAESSFMTAIGPRREAA